MSVVSPLQAFRDLLNSGNKNMSSKVNPTMTFLLEDLKSIPSGIDENEYLMRFLRFKSEPQRAYETLVKYHEFRKSDKKLFGQMRPYNLQPLFDSKIITKLPGNDAKGNPVILVNCKHWDEKVYSVEDLILQIMLIFEELIRTKVSRVAVVIDWEGYGFSHYRQLTYRNLVRSFALAKGSFPISFKGIHQVNQSKLFWLVSKILFSLLSAKLKKRMHIHGTDRESLAAHIPFSSLSAEYGGTSEGDVDTAFMHEMYKNEKYYEALADFD